MITKMVEKHGYTVIKGMRLLGFPTLKTEKPVNMQKKERGQRKQKP